VPQSSSFARWRENLTQLFLERVLRAPPDVHIHLGDRLRQHSPYVRLETSHLWAREPLNRKARALLRGRWSPDNEMVEQRGRELYQLHIFGGAEDCGEDLLTLNDWLLGRDWPLDALTEADRRRADALASFGALTRLRYGGLAPGPLNLRLGIRAPYVTDLIYPMTAKIPVLSVRYFLEVHQHFAFNAIRRANPPFSDDIIAFLYDLLYLQQKTAIGLLEYARLSADATRNKGDLHLTQAEVDAVMRADALFAYLKASVEKSIALVGITHGIKNLDAKKEHKKRVAALRAGLPPDVEKLPYAAFLLKMVGSENLESLNNYRSGLLHKKGIADLQPHNYVGRAAATLPLWTIFRVLHEQHAENTALLLVTLALLTDKLAELDPPPFSKDELPMDRKRAEWSKRAADEEIDLGTSIMRAGSSAPGKLFFERAQRRFALGREEGAVDDMRQALARCESLKPDLLVEIGRACMGLAVAGADATAVEAFSRAIAMAPDMIIAYIARAGTYENLKDLASAVADLDFVIPRVPEPALLLGKRGLWRLELGRFDEALADLRVAAAAEDAPVDVLTGLSFAFKSLGDEVAAAAALDDAIKRHPSAVVPRLHRFIASLVTGQDSAARADLDWLIENDPNDSRTPGHLHSRALLRSEAGDNAGAAEDMELAIASVSGSAPEEWTDFLTKLRGK
jgi:tetratricopeptide (TPR) repeat protein